MNGSTPINLNPSGSLLSAPLGNQSALNKFSVTAPTPAAAPSTVSLPSTTGGNSFNVGSNGSLKVGGPTVTPSGGTSFDPLILPQKNSSSGNSGLSQFVTSTSSTPSGGSVMTDGNGNVTDYNGNAGFQISGLDSVPSSALSSNTTANDINNAQSAYQNQVNEVAQAQGYSPAYIQALNQQYGAQTQGAALQANSTNINANVATGNGFTGFTTGQAQTEGGIQQNLNTQQEQTNAIQQLSANQQLNTQQLARTGAISAAQTQLQYSPTGMEGANAISSVNALSNQYPGAGILPTDSIETAQQKVAQSSAYQAGFQSTYSTPGGGTGIYSKLNMNGFTQNSDGSLTLVPAAAAALGSANANVVQNQVSNLSTINSAIQSSSKTAQSMTSFMNQYGLNQSNVPIINQIQNSVNSQLPKAGALTALNVDLNTLRSDYSQFLIGRGGSVAGTNQEATDAIPNNISPSQLQTVIQQMQQDGQNTADSVSQQINQALSGISTNTDSSTNTSSSSSASSGWY